MEGFEVVAGVRSSSNLASLESLKVTYRYGDVTRPETLKDMVAGMDYVIHNAGVIKAKRKDTFFQVNEKGAASLFEAIEKHNRSVRKVVLISSQAAAGPSTGGVPVAEKDPPHPITTYGKSKLGGERVALTYRDKLNVVVIRPPGVYGPGDREIFGFFQTVHRRIKPHIGDIHRRLHLVHVDDLCRGVFLAATSETRSGEVFFVAESKSYSMAELVELLEAASGKRAFSVCLPGSVFRGIARLSEFAFKAVGATPMLTREKADELLASWEISTDKARRDFGFESQIPFEQGARETYRWYRRMGWLR